MQRSVDLAFVDNEDRSPMSTKPQYNHDIPSRVVLISQLAQLIPREYT